jgi:hypothetical protein
MSARQTDRIDAATGKFILSNRYRVDVRKRFLTAGQPEIPFGMLGRLFFASIILTVLWCCYIIYATALISDYGIFFAIAVFIIAFALFEAVMVGIAVFAVWLYLEVATFNRTQSIEANLPLFLREFSTNLKAGREFVDALEDSLTPELGPLNDDISAMVVRIRSGTMVPKVLKEYAQRYDSYTVTETFEIILDSFEGGGGLSEIIDRIADNLEVIQYLKKNAIASVSNYVIFTSIVSLFIAPLLFALSYNLLSLISKLLQRVLISGAGGNLPFNLSALDISFSDFSLFSRLAIAIISGSAAAIIGLIRTGKFKGAAVMIIIFILISLLVYEISLAVLTHVFSSLFQYDRM